MDAGAAQALVHLGVAAGVMGSLRAHTAETIHIIDAGGTLATGIGGALIDVNVTSLPCESWRADTTVTIDAIHTGSMDTRVASTVIKINFTINP
jgi:hypothetical protein